MIWDRRLGGAATERPVIIAHPNALQTNLDRVPDTCLIELNNRYLWRCDWRTCYGPYRDRFQFLVNSDNHQPNWLSQRVARMEAAELDVQEIPNMNVLKRGSKTAA